MVRRRLARPARSLFPAVQPLRGGDLGRWCRFGPVRSAFPAAAAGASSAGVSSSAGLAGWPLGRGAASSAAGASVAFSSGLASPPAAASGSGAGVSAFARKKAMMAARFLSSATPGKAIIVPGANACGILQPDVERLIGPVALMRLQRRCVIEALDRGDLAPHHAVEIGADDGRAALLEAVTDLAQRGVGLALLGIGVGDKGEEGCVTRSPPPGFSSPPGFASPAGFSSVAVASGRGGGLSFLVRRKAITSARCLASGRPWNSAILVPGANTLGCSIMWSILR